jgi:exportin-5
MNQVAQLLKLQLHFGQSICLLCCPDYCNSSGKELILFWRVSSNNGSLAHSFSDPRSWGELPLQLRDIPSRVLRDRYWQVGITTGSREDFYSSIEESKSTMEGLASTIRGSLRMVREASYRLLYSMSLLDDAIYKYEELPVPLAKAFFTDASALTIHQTSVILTGLPSLIYSCPAECRPHFIPPILTAMFEFLDQKVSTEWERLDRARTNAGPDDDLVEEMKDEAILRQLTQTCITMVVRLLDPDLCKLTSTSHPSC